MNYLSASIMMLFIAAMLYVGTLIATSIYAITYPEAFETVLLLIGKFPISLSILSFVAGLCILVLHFKERT